MSGSFFCLSASPKIAVVDDDLSVCQAVQRLLRTAHFHVECYSNADELLRSPTLESQDCLVLDIQMPGLSGLDLQKVILSRRAPIPIIFITAHRDEDVRKQALEGGAVGFLEKPFDAQSLIRLVQKALEPSSCDVPVPLKEIR